MSANKISLPQGPELTEKDFYIKKGNQPFAVLPALHSVLFYIIFNLSISHSTGQEKL